MLNQYLEEQLLKVNGEFSFFNYKKENSCTHRTHRLVLEGEYALTLC